MREVVLKMDEAKRRAERLKGVTVRLKINKGRNKFIERIGEIEDLYPAVFSFRSGEEVSTFSYSDLLTKIVRIYPVEEA
ncbi:MAG: Veg family protein [Clostridia bacterium]|nr:Veg family protein [Clostridia bacterium]